VDQSGQPRPFYEEVQQLIRDFAAASPTLAGSTPVAEVALLNSYENRWAIHWQRHHRDFDYGAHFVNHYYRPLAARNISADIISADAPLDGYRLVIAPALHLLNETRAARLRSFVEKGGHLVLTLRSGMKDDFNALLPMRQPGLLADVAGVEVEDYYALLDPVPVIGEWLSGTSRLWAERLKVRDELGTYVIARYGASNGWLDGQPAITLHHYGAGQVYFVGAYLDDDSQCSLLGRITQAASVQPVMETPAGVEARKRVNAKGEEVVIIINHERLEQSVPLPWPARERLSDRAVESELKLEPYGVAVLTPLN
jgi:beta-galactosidase